MAEGFYDRPEVREAIADAVLDSGLGDDVQGEVRQGRQARQDIQYVPDVRDDRVEQAKRRIATGFYDLQATREEIGRTLSETLI